MGFPVVCCWLRALVPLVSHVWSVLGVVPAQCAARVGVAPAVVARVMASAMVVPGGRLHWGRQGLWMVALWAVVAGVLGVSVMVGEFMLGTVLGCG